MAASPAPPIRARTMPRRAGFTASNASSAPAANSQMRVGVTK
jgi:hypothetical protein